MASALGLAVYFAERNTGAYHNLFMSFSDESNVHELKGETLAQKLSSIDMSDWNSSTNLQEAFAKVLEIAVKNAIPKDEMVKSLIVITDMEINPYIVGDWTFYDAMKAMYESNGYDIPNVVYWNVNSRHDVYHADSNRKGVQLVSGQSASTFKQLVGGIGMTPVEMMLKVLNNGRYDLVTVEGVK
jgi:WD40 repeat protein